MSTQRSAVSADGTRIAFWTSGRGEPLVLIHGTTADHTRWDPVLPALEQHFTVYAVDRRGRGGSGDADAYAIERECEDVRTVLDHVAGPVTLLGHSYGAICALEASLRRTDVTRLILYEPPIPVGVEIYAPGQLERMDALLAAGDREGVLLTFMTEIVRVPPPEVEQTRSLPGWDARVGFAHTVVRELKADAAYRFEPARWRRFPVPTLLLYGGDSPGFLVEATAMLHDVLPHSSLRMLPGQQHLAMNTAPALFAEEVLRFTGKVS